MNAVEIREMAKSRLKILFNRPNPTEEDIMYVVGLISSGADLVGLAIAGIPSEEYEKSFPPSNPEDDVVIEKYYQDLEEHRRRRDEK